MASNDPQQIKPLEYEYLFICEDDFKCTDFINTSKTEYISIGFPYPKEVENSILHYEAVVRDSIISKGEVLLRDGEGLLMPFSIPADLHKGHQHLKIHFSFFLYEGEGVTYTLDLITEQPIKITH